MAITFLTNEDEKGFVKSVNGKTPDENGNVEIDVSSGNADHVGVEPAKRDIPRVFFGSPLQQTKNEAVTTFSYRSETLSFDCYAEIKAQGNSTMSWPKKNQTVKLYKDAACTEKFKVDFKGWGKQNKFVIKANWRDLTHVRDIVSVRLEGDCIRTNPEYDELPELLKTSPNVGGIDGFPVLVYAGGIYQGRYMWNIPKDKWMTNMDDDLNEHCILCSEDYASGCFRKAASINGSDWTDEIHDTVPASIKTRWNEVISFVMNSTDEEFAENLDSHIKVSTLIDRHIMGMLSCDFDGYGKNQLYITYDGQQWYADRYDKDGTWGNFWSGNSMLPSNYRRDQYEDFKNGGGNLLFIRLEQLFWQKLQSRWAELRTGALSIPNIINRFRELYDITPPYLIEEDYASTTANGAFTEIPNKTTCTIQQIQQFVVERHAWTDEYIAGLTPAIPVPCEGISLDKDALTFTAEGSQTLTATVTPNGCTDTVRWESTDNNIASVSGGVVTAKANGSVTITAICGEHSATCSVTVSGIESGEDADDGIDYALDALAGVAWVTGEEYNTTTGAPKTVSGCYRTDKFTAQECRYTFTSTGGGDNKLHVWDENDNYIGAMTRFTSGILKAGHKYAISLYNTSGFDTDSAHLMPEKVESTGTVSIDLSTLTWNTNGSGDAEAKVASYGIDLTKIKTANTICAFAYNAQSTNPGDTLLFSFWDATTLLAPKFSGVEAQSYFAENPYTLVLNP